MYTFICYERCSTCKKAEKWLSERGIEFEKRPIKENNPSEDELKKWLKLSDLPLRRLFNTSGQLYRELGVKEKLDAGMSESDALKLLASDGMIVKRPVLVGDGFALFGFKEAEWAEKLGV